MNTEPAVNLFDTYRARRDSDRRIAWLHDFVARTKPATGYGMAGGRAVFAFLASVENIQCLRAEALIQARLQQLMGYHPGVAQKLARSQELRRQVKARTAS